MNKYRGELAIGEHLITSELGYRYCQDCYMTAVIAVTYVIAAIASILSTSAHGTAECKS